MRLRRYADVVIAILVSLVPFLLLDGLHAGLFEHVLEEGRQTKMETTSAIGKDSQTLSSAPVRESRYAAGTSTSSWRAAEM